MTHHPDGRTVHDHAERDDHDGTHVHAEGAGAGGIANGHAHDEHDDAHDDGHEHGHAHDNDHGHGRFAWLSGLAPFLHGHSHGPAEADAALESSARGIRALKLSLVGLAATAAFQLIIVMISGSVALLADTVHNFTDALTAVPLWIAFAAGRRAANRRYTYGYGRAEDLAGVVIVVVIGLSAVIAAYESVRRLLDPTPVDNLGWVMVAAVIGFFGNEAVAIYRIRVGRAIGSAALVADGQHARVDGFTSLAVLVGALGMLAGFPLADPLVGLLITAAILVILRGTTVEMWRRMMDAVDPALVDRVEQTAAAVSGIDTVGEVRIRWIGHKLHVEVHVGVDEELPTRESHRLAEEVRHDLFHSLPQLATITVHVDPCGHGGDDHHDPTEHHERRSSPAAATPVSGRERSA